METKQAGEQEGGTALLSSEAGNGMDESKAARLRAWHVSVDRKGKQERRHCLPTPPARNPATCWRQAAPGSRRGRTLAESWEAFADHLCVQILAWIPLARQCVQCDPRPIPPYRRSLPRTALRSPTTPPAGWSRLASCPPRRSSCSWRCALVSWRRLAVPWAARSCQLGAGCAAGGQAGLCRSPHWRVERADWRCLDAVAL